VQGNLTVLGSSSIQYVTSSQLNIGNNKIVLNTSTPAVQFGGISVVDSGSGQATGSLYWDSLSNRWISQRETGAAYNSAILIAGPKNVGNLGQELGLTTNNIPVVTDGIHLGDSQITDNGTTVSITNNLSVGTAITASIVTATSYSSSIANGVGYFGTSSFATSASFAPTILPAGIVSSSLQINTGSFTGSFTGILSGSVFGTASNAISSSFATTASAATSITFTPLTSSFAETSSAATSITFTPLTASFANTASAATSITFTPLTASFANTASAATSITFTPLTASFAETSSAATSITFTPSTASFANTASAATSITFTPLTASFANTASAATSITFTPSTASFATSASYALSASYAPGGVIVVDTHTFTGDGIVSNYTLGKAYDISSVTVTVGGLTQTSTTHYTLTGTNLSFLVAPPSQSSIFVRAIVNVSTGSVGSFSGSFTGILLATNVLSSSFATTASAATSITFTPLTASFATTASAATSITFTPQSASFATSASFAPTILPTGIVSSSEQINTGSFTGSFIGTHSGSTFGTASRAESSSYALYAGFAEQSITTIAVTNNGASYYLLDGVVKPVVTFVPGTTYRFDTSGVVGSHPFRFSLSANGPTEYTSGVTVGANYTEIDVNYATSSSLFYYCTFHAGMGNQANTLRSENLITASQTGSMSVLSSSYASTASVATSSSFATSASYAPTILPTGTISSSVQVQLNELTGTTFSASNFTFPQNLTVAGTLVAQEFITEYVSSSVIYESGSTKFGDTFDDTHQFTGSVLISGSGVVIGSFTASAISSNFTGSLFGTASFANTASAATSITFTPLTSSFAETSSAATSITFTPLTSSFATTASNIVGGTTRYIPLWSNATSLSSSVLFQSASNLGINTTTPSASFHVVGTMMMQGVIEQVKITASAPPSTLNVDALSGSVVFLSASSANNWTVNFRGSAATSLNSMMYPGQSMTFAVLVNHATVGYTASIHQVDGTTIMPRWQGGTLPSGSGTSTDIYSYTLIKTANAAFNIFAAQTKFA
jgi:hypothetical protein